jgi:hypothetical protein
MDVSPYLQRPLRSLQEVEHGLKTAPTVELVAAGSAANDRTPIPANSDEPPAKGD